MKTVTPFSVFRTFKTPLGQGEGELTYARLRDADGNVLIDASGNAFVRRIWRPA